MAGDQVYREGIDQLDSRDFAFAADLGYTPKLLAIAQDTGDGISVRVHPALVPFDHPLAAVRGATNAIFVSGPSIGELLFTGPGAGGDPTATAVLGDVIVSAREILAGTQVRSRIRFAPGQVLDFSASTTKWYLRLVVKDQPGVFGRGRISVRKTRRLHQIGVAGRERRRSDVIVGDPRRQGGRPAGGGGLVAIAGGCQRSGVGPAGAER